MVYELAKKNAVGIAEIDPVEVARSAEKVRIVDVREIDEFSGPLGHIQGSECVPLGTIATTAASWDKSAELVLVCRSGNRSATATQTLEGLGFSHVMNMTGGMLRYNELGLTRAPG